MRPAPRRALKPALTACALGFGLVTAVALSSSDAHAGDRRLEILIVNMSPTSTDAGRDCMNEIVRRARADYTSITRLGETPTRRLAGHEGESGFLDWTYDDLRPVRERGETYLDAIALVDCRPDERRADILISSPAGGVTRVELRDVRIDRDRARWLADTILRQGWVGFSP